MCSHSSRTCRVPLGPIIVPGCQGQHELKPHNDEVKGLQVLSEAGSCPSWAVLQHGEAGRHGGGWAVPCFLPAAGQPCLCARGWGPLCKASLGAILSFSEKLSAFLLRQCFLGSWVKTEETFESDDALNMLAVIFFLKFIWMLWGSVLTPGKLGLET